MPEIRFRRLHRLACLSGGVCAVVLVMVGAYPMVVRPATAEVTTIQLQPIVTTGLSTTVYVTNAHDGSNRLFIIEQPGRIRVLQPGQTSPTVFLDITAKVMFGGEQGLLGLAFHPQFKVNGRFFVNYTRKTDGATVIAEYHVSPTNPDIASTAEIVILTIAQPFANHNGGMIEFGADGFLYIAMGDGGDGNDPGNRAQNINELLGKILRIDIDHANGPVPYSSPPDNPFFGPISGRDEIYAVGMRNPWRFSFDRLTHQLYCADVGQAAWEEIDIITLGDNCGWRVYEGNHCTNLDPPLCNPFNFVFPIAEYGHTMSRCSITGGYVYRGPIGTLPTGSYVYADFCTGEIFLLENRQQSLLLDAPINITSFGEDEAGEIYVVGFAGAVYRIVNPNAPCSFFTSPSSQFLPATGGPGSVVITTPVNCGWTAMSNDSFINVTTGSGTGTGAALYSVEPNPGASRVGTVGVAGNITIITQGEKGNPFDFDRDSRTDLAVFRTGSSDEWLITNSSDGSSSDRSWGLSGDLPVPGDYDGDFKTDIAVWRPTNGTWYVLRSSNGSVDLQGWGVNGDIPVPGDYDGDGKTDKAVWRPSTGVWYIINSGNGSIRVTRWGINGDVPLIGDFDGDGLTDIAVWRPSNGTWYITRSSDSVVTIFGWGVNTDKAVPADYDGDGKTDLAVWRPSNGTWYVINSKDGSFSPFTWGFSTDQPVTGDFDRDGMTDIAVWRPSTGTWYIINSSSGAVRTQVFGVNGDVPVPAAFIR